MNHEPLRYAHEEGHTDVCFSEDGTKFVTCGIEGDIRVWSVSGEDPVHSCIGEWACSIRQKKDSIYVSTGNNDVQILTFPQGERDGVLDRFVAPINQLALSRDSAHVALAGEDMEAKLVDLGKGEREVVVFDGMKGPCLSVAINSKFLAASSGDGKLRIWEVESREMVKEVECFPKVNSFANAKVLCRLDWHPDGRFLAYPHGDKVVLLVSPGWGEAATLSSSQVTAGYSIVQFSPCGGFLMATTAEGDFVLFDVRKEVAIGVSKHPNSSSISGFMWNPLGNGQIVYTDVDGQLGIISDCIKPSAPPTPQTSQDDDLFTDNPVDFGDVNFDDDDDDDDNVVSVEKIKKQVMGDEESELNFDDKSSHAPTPRPRTPEIPLQPPFMPSSTPAHLNPRYLCWNQVGIVKCYGSAEDDDIEKSIEVEFHDLTFHNAMILQNYQDYVMGSLSKSALVTANQKQLYVVPLKSSAKEWLLKLEDGPDEIILVAASDNLVSFGVSNYLVRVCSIYGTQMGVVALPGPLVTMASYDHTVAAAYHSSAIRRGDQCIDIKLIKFNGLAVECTDIRAALGPETTLSWLGFSDLGTLGMADSQGMISLYPASCNAWLPICDARNHLKGPSDGFFVTAVLESCQTLMGIKCRGSVYPAFAPKPTVSEVEIAPPFAEAATEKTQLEMNLFAWSNLQIRDVERRFTESGLKTFVLACKNSLDQRALELMEILSNPQLMALATKYAIKLNKKLLAERLMELTSGLEREPEEVATPQRLNESRLVTLNTSKRTPRTPKPVSQDENSENTSVIQDSESSIFSVDGTPAEEVRENPFFKGSKGGDKAANPLSLVNKFAGVDYTSSKESKLKNGDVVEKRKRPESEGEKQRDKQRKLDRFMFTKS